MQVDISLMGYEHSLKFLFDHPAPAGPDVTAPRHRDIQCEASRPASLVSHVTRLCRELSSLGNQYSPEQIDQGLWFLVSLLGDFPFHLLDAGVPLEHRVACVESMYLMYADYVPSITSAVPNCFDMWWDILCHGFWMGVESRLHPRDIEAMDATAINDLLEQAGDVLHLAKRILAGEKITTEQEREAALAQTAAQRAAMVPIFTEDERSVFDALFDILSRILQLPCDPCQHFALHGLGHLYHPQAKALVLEYLAHPPHALSDDYKAWLRQCAVNQIM